MADSNSTSTPNSDTHDRLTMKLEHLGALLLVPQDCGALDRANPLVRSSYLHLGRECVDDCQKLAAELWQERQAEAKSRSENASARPKGAVELDNDWSAGARLANGYDPREHDGHRTLITAMETAATAGSEAVRGFGEELHKYIAAILRTPCTGTPTVQQQLQRACDDLYVAHSVFESINEEAEHRLEDGAPFGLFGHAAQRGMEVVNRIEAIVDDVRNHRPAAAAQS